MELKVVEKVCRVCSESKPLCAFSDRPSSKDGKRNDCKKCRANSQKSYSATPSGKEVQRRADKKRNPILLKNRAARTSLFRAVSAGKVERLPCWVCGENNSEAHHPDYTMPKDVVWLCKPHHKQLHLEAKKYDH